MLSRLLRCFSVLSFGCFVGHRAGLQTVHERDLPAHGIGQSVSAHAKGDHARLLVRVPLSSRRVHVHGLTLPCLPSPGGGPLQLADGAWRAEPWSSDLYPCYPWKACNGTYPAVQADGTCHACTIDGSSNNTCPSNSSCSTTGTCTNRELTCSRGYNQSSPLW